MVKDFVELQRDQMIELRDTSIDHRLGIFGDRHGPLQHLSDELFHQVFAALPRSRVAREASLFHDLIEQAVLGRLFGAGLSQCCLLRITHRSPP